MTSECPDLAVTGRCRDRQCQGNEKGIKKILGQQFQKWMLKKLGWDVPSNTSNVKNVNAVKVGGEWTA